MAFGGDAFVDNVEIAVCPVALTGLTSAHYLLRHNGEFEDVTNDPADLADGVRYVSTPVNPLVGRCLPCGIQDRKMHCSPC